MNKTLFEVTKSVLENNNEGCTVYGIKAFALDANNKITLDEVLDVSSDLEFVKQLVEKFNHFDLHIEHFRDTLYDCICAEYSL